MYSVVLIDDEYMILKGLARIVNWEEQGFEIKQSFTNSQKALDYLTKNPTDLVLTDVSMPGLTGIDLIKETKDRHLSALFIIISGYQEFDFVKAGMKLGAINYLMKPVDKKELSDTLQKVNVRLRQEKQNKETEQILLENQIKLVFDDELPESELALLFNHLQLTDSAIKQGLTVILFNNVIDKEPLTRFLKEQNQQLFFTHKKEVVLGYLGTTNEINKIVHQIESLQLISGEQFITIGETVFDIELIGESYDQAKSLAQIYYFYEKEGTVNSLIYKQVWLKNAVLPKVSLVNFQQALSLGDQTKLGIETAEIYRNLYEDNASPDYVRQITFLMLEEINNKSANPTDLTQSTLSQMLEASRMEELEGIVKSAITQLSTRKRPEYSQIVTDVVNLIDSQFSQDLTLKRIADDFHMNPTYLGQLFKKETKKSFAKYLNQYRIERAQTLLKNTGKSIGEVASETGYANANYFFKNFRLLCGISPKEYRDQYQN